MRLTDRMLRLGPMVWAGMLVCTLAVSSPAATITGSVTDAKTGKPVVAATVRISGTGIGVMSDEDGRFELAGNLPDRADLVVQHVAYRLWRRSLAALDQPAEIRLTPVILPGQDIVVTSTRAVRGESPVAFDNITKEDIRQSYYAQDVPQLLTESPSVYSFSDNGNAIGYSYMSIRGFSQRRVSVLINGVPLNDPESHEVYWIDLPDLPASIDDAQIQRGVGTTLYGANSIGGTVNLQTDQYSPLRELRFTSGFGSYGTRKFSIVGNSGLIDDQYTIYGRYSRIVSDGYRNNAWTDLWSYFFAAARYDEKWTNRVNIFGGPEQTHLAYKGIPRWYLNGDVAFYDTSAAAQAFTNTPPTGDPDIDRRYNPFEWNDETDNFNQPQYQFISEYRPDSNWLIENTLFYIKGKGYYDQLRFGEDFAEYHLNPFAQIVMEGDSAVTTEVDEADQLWRRRWVENDFWGIIPKVTRKHTNGTLTFGGELQHHRGDHWAEVQSVRPAPPEFVPGQRYYDYQGRKIVVSGFAQEVYTPAPKVTMTGALQYSFKQYKLFDDRFPNLLGQTVSHTTDYNFLSPRVGVTVRPREGLSVFGSVSYNEQEPTNDEVFDPQDYYADARDFFKNFNPETGQGSDPIMNPERLTDYEFGASLRQDRFRIEANLFYMLFKDEIVYNGQINDDGVPIRANAPSSVHRGIEIAAEATPVDGLTLRGNLSINDNTFDEYVENVVDWSTWPPTITKVDRAGNVIAGFPKHLANLRATYEQDYFSVSGHLFRAGRQYIDNSMSSATTIDPYTVVNARGAIKLDKLLGYPGMSFFVQVNNLFDQEYETGGYIDDGFPLFLPAAKRNFFAGMRAEL
jgi:iron complex outermembrane receptor protein